MGKYAISNEYKKIAKLKPPVGRFVLAVSQKFLKPTKKVFRDDVIDVELYKIAGYKEGEIDIFILSPILKEYFKPFSKNLCSMKV